MSINALNDPLSNAVARGKRLKILRKMADLSREKMEELYGISANTIQSWEAAKAGGLTKKGADRIIQAFHNEGISCSVEWLLYGIGISPALRAAERYFIKEPKATYAIIPEDKAIIRELQTFRALNPGMLDTLIQDTGMLPHYKPGDYVAGRRRFGEEIKSLIGSNCIVELNTNEILLRRIQRQIDSELYTLNCINPDCNLPLPTLYEQKLLSAAPVIWHRRPDPHQASKSRSRKKDRREYVDDHEKEPEFTEA